MLSGQLGELLRASRKELGISREALAESAGVSTRLIAEVERGERPNVSLESTLRLLSLVGISITATSPSGVSARVHDSYSSARERQARAAFRRRTWTGRRISLREEGEAPALGRSKSGRLATLSRVSKQAHALSTFTRSGRRER